MRTLHLTNGSSIVPLIRDAGIAGDIVPWDDVLHEGPVPQGLNIAALRERRAEFLASCGWGTQREIALSLERRDAALHDLQRFDEVVLWFEHDLYDQLQLLQILDRLPDDGTVRVTAVPGDDYLGYQPASSFIGLYEGRREITSSQRLAARDGWDAFRADDPHEIVRALPRVTALPHLAPALTRHLQQFPSRHDGLSRTEAQALDALVPGPMRVSDWYRVAHHEREEAIFMGDAAFLFHMGDVLRSPRPLIRLSSPPRPGRRVLTLDDEVALTEDGRTVLEGGADRVTMCGIERWLGGVHLSGHQTFRFEPSL